MHWAFAILALLTAACWRGQPTAPPPIEREDRQIVSVRSAELVATTALPDGGLVLAATGTGPTLAGSGCPAHEQHLMVARLDARGRVIWVRCLEPTRVYANAQLVHVAASSRGVWLVRVVDPDAPDHVHGDVHDLVVVDRWKLDGSPIDSRVVITWRDQPGANAETQAYFRRQTLRLAAAVAREDELLLGGAAIGGAIVDGRWELRAGTTGAGFVLAVPARGPVRAIVDEHGVTIDDVAVAGRRFVATGRCWRQHARAEILCPISTAPFVLAGNFDAPARTIHFLRSEFDTVRAAIDAAGNIVAAASLFEPVTVDGTAVIPRCGIGPMYAMAASWTRSGELRFARSLGECTPASPDLGDQTGVHDMNVFDVAIIDGRTHVSVQIHPRGAGGDGPIRFDAATMSASNAVAAAVLELDERGRVARTLRLRAITQQADPDASGSPPEEGVRAVDFAAASVAWLAVEHTGSLHTGERVVAGSGIELLPW